MIGELGHYKVGDKIFFDKVEAILHANRTLADTEWFYHNEKFDSVDWTKEPELSVDHYYKIRAQQLRDKYDYIVAFFSGGADSSNVVYSFINNNIRLDEIVISDPASGLKNFKYSKTDTNSTNHISEIKYAAFPEAAKIAASNPEIKITINEMFENILDLKDHDWAFTSGDWVHPTAKGRFSLNRIPHLKELAESGKRIAIVYGTDKPALYCSTGGFLYSLIVDYGVNVPMQPFDIVYPNVDRVLFYWTPDLPEMIVKQSHIVAKNIYKPENSHVLKYLRDQRKPQLDPIADRRRQNRYERLIVPWIYPSIPEGVFQADKQSTVFLGEHDAWLYNLHNNSRIHQMVMSDVSSLINGINEKYFLPGKTAFKMHYYSWKLGHESQFRPITQVN